MKKILIIIVVIAFSGCSTNPPIINGMNRYSADGVNSVFVLSHGWHTGFAIPSTKLYESVPALRKRFGKVPYIELGWGDKGFYQAEEITSGLIIRAILWPTESVIHAVGVPTNVYEYFPNSEINLVCLNDQDLSLLIEFVSGSFLKNERDEVMALKNGIYGDSQFYRGVGKYYMMNTCNNWTAKGLKSAGMDISPTFKLTAGSIMGYLDEKADALTTESGECQKASLVPHIPPVPHIPFGTDETDVEPVGKH